tara:strand:+ start:593 stop:1249 length:657 start_codon:yes stop_codon:yes gene_type:complete
MHTDVALIEIRGKNIASFLTGITTNTVSTVPTLNAFCNQSGKVIALGAITMIDDYAHIAIHQSLIADIEKHLAFYGRFSRVKIKVLSAFSRYLGNWVFEPDGGEGELTQWYNHLYEKGVVFLDSVTTAQFTPQMLAYDRLELIDWDKGCYLGQEVVVRIAHKGKNKRNLYRIITDKVPQVVKIIQKIDSSKCLGVVADSDIEYIKNDCDQIIPIKGLS